MPAAGRSSTYSEPDAAVIRIELLGTSFQIQSDESPEYVTRLLTHYRARVAEIERTVPTGDALKKAILAALLVTDELYQERAGQTVPTSAPGPEQLAEMERITNRIIERLDSALPE